MRLGTGKVGAVRRCAQFADVVSSFFGPRWQLLSGADLSELVLPLVGI